jgi:glycosyltransferase involved in cell wall biosynthesis
MHILLIHQAFAAIDEAGGTRHHEFARFLAERGHRVTVIASPVSYLTGSRGSTLPAADTQSDGVTIRRVYTYSALHRSFVHRVISFLSFMVSSFWTACTISDVDLVWGTTPPIFQGLTAWAVARIKGVPFLFEVRDLWPAFAVAVGVLRSPVLIRLSEWLERFLYRGADRVMVNSPGFVRHVTLRGARRVEVVPNGADPGMFDQPDLAPVDAFRKAYHLEGKYLVVYAGAHGLSNDLGVILEAAAHMPTGSRLHYVFLGDGKEKPFLQRRAAAMKLENVTFLPPFSKKEMSIALAAADACVAILKPVDLYKTTYPNKVFDYMAAGRPVILAIDGVIREVVENSGAGVFVRPGDSEGLARAAQRLAENPEAARQMGAAGRECVVRGFSRSAQALKLAEILAEMLEFSKRSRIRGKGNTRGKNPDR